MIITVFTAAAVKWNLKPVCFTIWMKQKIVGSHIVRIHNEIRNVSANVDADEGNINSSSSRRTVAVKRTNMPCPKLFLSSFFRFFHNFSPLFAVFIYFFFFLIQFSFFLFFFLLLLILFATKSRYRKYGTFISSCATKRNDARITHRNRENDNTCILEYNEREHGAHW